MFLNLSFERYKAFEKGNLNVRPITILLGANSVGKSSLMQLFLMLQQTLQSERNYKSALRLNGGFISLGEGLNLIRRKDQNSTLQLSIEFESQQAYELLHKQLFKRYLQELTYFTLAIDKLYGKKSRNWVLNVKKLFPFLDDGTHDIEIIRFLDTDLTSEVNEDIYNEMIEKTFSSLISIHEESLPSQLTKNYALYRESFNFLDIKKDKSSYVFLYKFLESLSQVVASNRFKVNWEIEFKEKILLLKTVEIFNSGKLILKISFNNKHAVAEYELSSEIVDFKEVQSFLRTNASVIFYSNKTIFNFVRSDEDQIKSGKTQLTLEVILSKVVSSIIRGASEYFDQRGINYVSPLRAHPKRYYFLDKAKYNTYLDTLDGDAITEILKEKSYIKTLVNDWLEKFNLKIDVSHLQDIIHRLVVNQNKLELDITDVGFGISQVLPVIIQGFLSHDKSITLIEQPEIHLHPKMQADLADLFIDIVFQRDTKKHKKYLVIETHSEYLLKRIRRRISEGKIRAEDVGIYLIDPQTQTESGKIRELKIEDKGSFEWPKDFYGGELLKDTTEFLKNQ